MSDEEQVEKLREWWDTNGRSVMAGVIIAIASVVGWQQYGAWQDRQADAAAAAYMHFMDAVERGGDPDAVVTRAERLLEDHGGSAYASMAALHLAAVQHQVGDPSGARETLRWVREEGSDRGFRDLGRLRLAQLLYGEDELDAALDALEGATDGPYEARYNELRGDIHSARGDRDAAREAYRAALEADDLPAMRRSLITLKLNELGGEVPS